MTELVPLPDAVRALPAPSQIGDALKQELSSRVGAERIMRGDVHQPEDVYALVRPLAAAYELLTEYAHQFTSAARVARAELETELTFAVGEQDGIPQGKLTVPDGDVEVRLAPDHGNTHTIDLLPVLSAVIADILGQSRDTEPEQEPGETDRDYLERYERWMAAVIHAVIEGVFALGTFSPQVSKVQAYAVDLASRQDDQLSAVVRSSVQTTRRYKGVKYERKERKHA